MVAVVWAEYCELMAGLSIDRRKIDLLDCVDMLVTWLLYGFLLGLRLTHGVS